MNMPGVCDVRKGSGCEAGGQAVAGSNPVSPTETYSVAAADRMHLARGRDLVGSFAQQGGERIVAAG